LYKNVVNALKIISFEPTVVFTYLPFFPDILKRFNAKIIYDCVDDHASFPGLINPKYVEELEKETVAFGRYSYCNRKRNA